jgi:hypothetical protein
MAGSGGLGHSQNGDEITDTEFSVQQQMEDSQPRSVRKRPEHQIDLVSAHPYIRLGDYTMSHACAWSGYPALPNGY